VKHLSTTNEVPSSKDSGRAFHRPFVDKRAQGTLKQVRLTRHSLCVSSLSSSERDMCDLCSRPIKCLPSIQNIDSHVEGHRGNRRWLLPTRQVPAASRLQKCCQTYDAVDSRASSIVGSSTVSLKKVLVVPCGYSALVSIDGSSCVPKLVMRQLLHKRVHFFISRPQMS
jgi:hypothetical protein